MVPEAPAGVPQRAWTVLFDLISLLNEFTLYLFVPLPLWLLTVAWARTRSAALATVLPWVLFGGLYGLLFLPRPAHFPSIHRSFFPHSFFLPRPADAEVTNASGLRVMTFNIWEVARPVDGVVEAVRQADPDVLAVQELTPAFARELDQVLSEVYSYQRLRPARVSGLGIWSRYPVRAEQGWPAAEPSTPGHVLGQHVALEIGERVVDVVNLHFDSPDPRVRGTPVWPFWLITGEATQDRRREVAEVAPRLRALAQGGATLAVAGDFNLTDQTPEYRSLLSSGLVDAYRAVGWGFGHTFPSPAGREALRKEHLPAPAALLRLDYVLYSRRLTARRVTVWPETGGSDHHPVVADLVLLAPPSAGVHDSGAPRVP